MSKKKSSANNDKKEEFNKILKKENETNHDYDKEGVKQYLKDKGMIDKPIPLGTKFSDLYEVISSEQSKGGMGKAILCKGIQDNKYYVLKTFLVKENEAIFRKEIEFTLKLDKHPNIVYTQTAIQEKIDDKYIIFMVMELVKKQQKHPLKENWWFAKTLADIIRNNEMDLEKAFTWSIEFCRGMQYLNSIGLESHKDIKPENIFITEDNHIKIADFGLVNFESKEYTAGSRKYMAPESRKGKTYNIQSDMYSFGIVMYEMFSSFIYGGNNFDLKNTKYCNEIIKKCISKDPKQRYNTFVELEDELLKESKKYFGENFEIENNQMTASDYFNKALGSEVVRNFDQAVELYTKAIKINPIFFAAYNNRGLARMETDRYNYWDVMGYKPYKTEELYSDFIKAINISNNEEQLIMAYNNATANWDNRELELDITIFPPSIPSLNGEAISFEDKIFDKGIDNFDSNKYRESINCFDNFLKKTNKTKDFEQYYIYASAYLFKGIARYNLKQYSLAVKDFNKALKICLDIDLDICEKETLLFNCYDCLSIVKYKQKKYLEAKKYKKEANKYFFTPEEISIYKEILKAVLAKYKTLNEEKVIKEIEMNSIKTIYEYIDYFIKQNNKKVLKVKVIGCGDSGTKTINKIVKFKLRNSIETYVINSDSLALKISNVKNKVLIGDGLGCKCDTEKAKRYLKQANNEIKNILKDTDLLILTTGMGGGTGTAVVCEMAKIAKEQNIPTIAVVTKPFKQEEKVRINNAEIGIKELKKHIKALFVLQNDNVANSVTKESFYKLNDILSELIQKFTTYINLQNFNRIYKELE